MGGAPRMMHAAMSTTTCTLKVNSAEPIDARGKTSRGTYTFLTSPAFAMIELVVPVRASDEQTVDGQAGEDVDREVIDAARSTENLPHHDEVDRPAGRSG